MCLVSLWRLQLGETQIDAEVAGTANVVALAGFSSIRGGGFVSTDVFNSSDDVSH
jgi:hypothetical protein